MNGLGESLSGTIRLTVPTISGELILPQAIAEFSAQYPQIHIDMELDNRFVDIVEEGFDLAIRTGALQDSSFIAKRLVEVRWIICGSPAYLNDKGIPTSPEELPQHNCLAYSYQETGANEWLFKRKKESGQGSEEEQEADIYTLRVKGNFTTNNAAALRKAALYNLGLIYVPKVLVAEDLQAGRLIEVLPNQVGKSLGIFAVYPYTRLQPTKVKLFIEHLYQCYQRQIDKF